MVGLHQVGVLPVLMQMFLMRVLGRRKSILHLVTNDIGWQNDVGGHKKTARYWQEHQKNIWATKSEFSIEEWYIQGGVAPWSLSPTL